MSIARPGDAEDSNVTTEEHEQVNQHFNVAGSGLSAAANPAPAVESDRQHATECTPESGGCMSSVPRTPVKTQNPQSVRERAAASDLSKAKRVLFPPENADEYNPTEVSQDLNERLNATDEERWALQGVFSPENQLVELSEQVQHDSNVSTRSEEQNSDPSASKDQPEIG